MTWMFNPCKPCCSGSVLSPCGNCVIPDIDNTTWTLHDISGFAGFHDFCDCAELNGTHILTHRSKNSWMGTDEIINCAWGKRFACGTLFYLQANDSLNRWSLYVGTPSVYYGYYYQASYSDNNTLSFAYSHDDLSGPACFAGSRPEIIIGTNTFDCSGGVSNPLVCANCSFANRFGVSWKVTLSGFGPENVGNCNCDNINGSYIIGGMNGSEPGICVCASTIFSCGESWWVRLILIENLGVWLVEVAFPYFSGPASVIYGIPIDTFDCSIGAVQTIPWIANNGWVCGTVPSSVTLERLS